jgi:ferric enterobactin receptor
VSFTKKSFFLCAFFILICCTVFSQTNQNETGFISATVVDSLSLKPVGFAVVAVFRNDSARPIVQTITSDSGEFRITNLPYGKYKIILSLLGYRSVVKKDIFLSAENPTADLGKIHFAGDPHMLQGTEIVAQQEVIENQIDKLVYHADKDVTSSAGTAIDVLKKVPGVSVDIDGNIEIEGTGGVRIFINGKPSVLMNSNPVDVLLSIPADQIKTIEVMTSPPAKYAAQGTGGIINIVLKKSDVEGWTGNVNLTAGTKMNKASGTIGYSHEDFSISADLGGNYFLPQNGATDNFRSTIYNDTTSILRTFGTSKTGRSNFFPTVDMEWEFSDNDDISASVSWEDLGNKSDGVVTTENSIADLNYEQQILRNTGSLTHERSLEGSVDYSHSFDTLGSELAISYEYSGDRDINDFSVDQQLFFSTANENPKAYLLSEKGNLLGLENEHLITADYTKQFLNENVFESGLSATIYDVNSNYKYNFLDSVSGNYIPDETQSNIFIFQQEVGAAYGSFTIKLKKIVLKPGLRYEYTINKSHLENSAVSYPNNYGTLIPSLAIFRKVNHQTFRLNYSRRIERPEYDEMNPFVNTSDRNNIYMGNPFLVPEQQNRIELGYSLSLKSGVNFNSSLYWRHQTKDIQGFTSVYPVFINGNDTLQNVAVTTRQNMVTRNSYGINFFGSATIFKKVDIRGNMNFSTDFLENTIDSSSAIVQTYRYRINLNLSWRLPWNCVAEIFGVFNSPRYGLQGYRPSYTEYSVGIKKVFKGEKASLGLSASNPFNKNVHFVTVTNGTGFSQRNETIVPFRSFGITFTYRFGSMKERKDDSDNQGNPLFQN